jgi:hypothetical protein
VKKLTESENVTPGRAESTIYASHLKRTRHIYTIIAATLYILQQKHMNIIV